MHYLSSNEPDNVRNLINLEAEYRWLVVDEEIRDGDYVFEEFRDPMTSENRDFKNRIYPVIEQPLGKEKYSAMFYFRPVDWDLIGTVADKRTLIVRKEIKRAGTHKVEDS